MEKIIYGNKCKVHRESSSTDKISPPHKNHLPDKTHHHFFLNRQQPYPLVHHNFLYVYQEKKKGGQFGTFKMEHKEETGIHFMIYRV